MKKITLATLSLAILAGNVHGDPYINIGGGGVFPTSNSGTTVNTTSAPFPSALGGSSVFTLPNVNWRNKYKTGFNVSAALGCQSQTYWRPEVEFLYQRFNRQTSGTYGWLEQGADGTVLQTFNNPIAVKSSPVNVYSILANAYYDFDCVQEWTPMLGIGIGIAWINSPGKSALSTLNININVPPVPASTPIIQRSPSLNGAAFASQLKVGTAYEWSRDLAIVLQYRLFLTTKFYAKQSSFTTNDGIPGAQTTFIVPKQRFAGLITNAVEIVFQFKL